MAEANASTFLTRTDNRKRMKFDIAPEDRISQLPDSILSHILSFLPTKISVKTSCLSKRWRYIWTSVPVLDLDDQLFKSIQPHRSRKQRVKEEESFKNFINRVLILRSHTCVKKFRLHLSSSYPTPDVHSWIFAAVQHDVEELDLYIDNFAAKLPMILFNSETLETLKLSRFGYCSLELNVPEFARLPNLKVVHLEYLANLCEADIDRLLAATPVLRELLIRMAYSQKIRRYSLVSSSLKTLILGNHGPHHHHYQVLIDAPKLEFLEFIDKGGEGFDFEVKRAPSIVKATLDMRGSNSCNAPNAEAMVSSLCSFSNVKVLSLSSYVLKAALSSEHDIHLNNLTKLVLGYCGDDLALLPEILKRLPALEALVLNKLPCCKHSEAWNQQEKSEIDCLKYTLKTLKLGRFEGTEPEMQMLEYFADNATMLNEVRTSSKLIDEKEPEPTIVKKLLRIPSSFGKAC